MPLPIEVNTTAWRERILSESDELKIADVALEMAQAEAARARANRVPDPTLGAYTASELGGREKFFGLRSPFPFHYRAASAARATPVPQLVPKCHVSRPKRSDASMTPRLRAPLSVPGAPTSLQIASEGAAAMHDNAALIQRAYTLGEVGLQDLLIARRQAASAEDNALRAQAEALHAYHGLVIDAHWVWDLEHE